MVEVRVTEGAYLEPRQLGYDYLRPTGRIVAVESGVTIRPRRNPTPHIFARLIVKPTPTLPCTYPETFVRFRHNIPEESIDVSHVLGRSP